MIYMILISWSLHIVASLNFLNPNSVVKPIQKINPKNRYNWVTCSIIPKWSAYGMVFRTFLSGFIIICPGFSPSNLNWGTKNFTKAIFPEFTGFMTFSYGKMSWIFCNALAWFQGTSTGWCFLSLNDMAVCQNLVPLVNIKIAGKWMFIPLKMVLIGIDPYPY